MDLALQLLIFPIVIYSFNKYYLNLMVKLGGGFSKSINQKYLLGILLLILGYFNFHILSNLFSIFLNVKDIVSFYLAIGITFLLSFHAFYYVLDNDSYHFVEINGLPASLVLIVNFLLILSFTFSVGLFVGNYVIPLVIKSGSGAQSITSHAGWILSIVISVLTLMSLSYQIKHNLKTGKKISDFEHFIKKLSDEIKLKVDELDRNPRAARKNLDNYRFLIFTNNPYFGSITSYPSTKKHHLWELDAIYKNVDTFKTVFSLYYDNLNKNLKVIFDEKKDECPTYKILYANDEFLDTYHKKFLHDEDYFEKNKLTILKDDISYLTKFDEIKDAEKLKDVTYDHWVSSMLIEFKRRVKDEFLGDIVKGNKQCLATYKYYIPRQQFIILGEKVFTFSLQPKETERAELIGFSEITDPTIVKSYINDFHDYALHSTSVK